MAGIEGGVSGALAGVGDEAASGLHVAVKPGTVLGAYRWAGVTGTLAAALAANAALWYLRWTDPTKLCVIHRFKAEFQPLTAFTAATLVDFGFLLNKATAVSAGGGGTDVFSAAGPTKMRASHANSLLAVVGAMRISNTAALTALTTVDTHPIAASLGDQQRVNPAAATEEQRVNDPTLRFEADAGLGEYPLVLAQNEGLVLRNRSVWPAAGTGIVSVEISWSEVSNY